jgi:hypothetical protein
MKNWQKVGILFLVTVAIGASYLFYVWKQRQNPGIIPQKDATQTLSQDDLAVVRELPMAHFEDLKDLEGKRIWMKSGYTMPYFPYAGGQVEFAKRVGLVPPAQPMDVKKFIKAPVPETVDDSLQHGARQVFAVFELPGTPGTFATPIGAIQGTEEHIFANMLFYYDDPHKIYDHWSKDMWAAVDAHQVKPGMSELQTRMSIGMKEHPTGETEGDRTVVYELDGKHWTITYEKNHATEIKTE